MSFCRHTIKKEFGLTPDLPKKKKKNVFMATKSQDYHSLGLLNSAELLTVFTVWLYF